MGEQPVMEERIMKTRLISRYIAAFALVGIFADADEAGAGPLTLRAQVNQRGDFVLTGNMLAHDCANGTQNIVIGTVGPCGTNVSDTAPDIYWRSESPNNAEASTAISPAQARSTAVLSLLPGALVTQAYLYWGAERSMDGHDTDVTLEPPGGTIKSLSALAGSAVKTATGPIHYYYQSVADVTDIVKTHGGGPYRVSGVDSIVLENQENDQAFAGWWMVVFYQHGSEPLRNIALFDGLGMVTTGIANDVTIGGFIAPEVVSDAKLGVVAYEGDNASMGDQLFVSDMVPLSDAINQANNFFNGTRSSFGESVSFVGDQPRTHGEPTSLSGVDIDIVDIAPKLLPGATSTKVTAASTGDMFLLAGLVTSIATIKDQCSSDADCVDPKLYCDTAATPNVCVGCSISIPCPGQAPTCDLMTHTCICEPTGTEICNGLDDNCDGTIDEGNFGEEVACTTEFLGICADGVRKCPASPCVSLVTPGSQAEVCDNSVDEDCDGLLNNGCENGSGGAGNLDEELIYYTGCVCDVRPGREASDFMWTLVVGTLALAARWRCEGR